jgi:hypothetical protein
MLPALMGGKMRDVANGAGLDFAVLAGRIRGGGWREESCGWVRWRCTCLRNNL